MSISISRSERNTPVSSGSAVNDSAKKDRSAVDKALDTLNDGGFSSLENSAGPGKKSKKSSDGDLEKKRMETIETLGRHEHVFKKAQSEKKRDELINDKDTPPDLKRALQDLKKDPDLLKALDTAKNGKTDGKISAEDINNLQNNKANKIFGDGKADTFEDTYMPSDAPKDAKARPINSNDAMRELFRYSDYLPKNISHDDLKKIADGSAEIKRAPPQLQAAAKFYADNPKEWTKAIGMEKDESIRRGSMCDRFAGNMKLTAEEHKVLKTLDKNRDVFVDGSHITEKKLDKILADDSTKPEVRKAAEFLRDEKGSMLFSMLDNAGKGSHGSFGYGSDDRKISDKDLNAMLSKVNKDVAPAEQIEKPESKEKSGAGDKDKSSKGIAAAQAKKDMSDGQHNQPEAKSKKGGQAEDIASGFMRAYSGMTSVASAVFGVLAKVPGIGPLFALASIGTAAAGAGVEIGRKAMVGEGTDSAGLDMGIAVGGAALGLIIPGGGKLVAESAEVAAKEGAKAGAKAGASKGAGGEAVETAGVESGKAGAKAGGARETAEVAGAQTGKTWAQRDVVGSGIRGDVLGRFAAHRTAETVAIGAAVYGGSESGLTGIGTVEAKNLYNEQVDKQSKA